MMLVPLGLHGTGEDGDQAQSRPHLGEDLGLGVKGEHISGFQPGLRPRVDRSSPAGDGFQGIADRFRKTGFQERLARQKGIVLHPQFAPVDAFLHAGFIPTRPVRQETGSHQNHEGQACQSCRHADPDGIENPQGSHSLQCPSFQSARHQAADDQVYRRADQGHAPAQDRHETEPHVDLGTCQTGGAR